MPATDRLAPLALALVLGCARTMAHPIDPSELPAGPGERPAVSAEAAPTPAPLPPLGPTAPVPRTALAPVIGRGLGRFLSTVEVSPVLAQGRFVGFRLERAEALPAWRAAGLDLRPGDVVTAINGHSIERPDEALAVFQSVRAAPVLRLAVVRPEGPVELAVPLRAD